MPTLVSPLLGMDLSPAQRARQKPLPLYCAPLGGLMANENATYLDDGEVDLVIGSQDSVFRYRLTISSKK